VQHAALRPDPDADRLPTSLDGLDVGPRDESEVDQTATYQRLYMDAVGIRGYGDIDTAPAGIGNFFR
jgi:hypothetical protein